MGTFLMSPHGDIIKVARQLLPTAATNSCGKLLREIAAAGNCSRKTGVSGSHYSHREICSNCAEQLRTGVGFPSWLTFLCHMKDSLWSCDLFRCESATLRTYWVLVVMDQFTRRLIGFGIHCGIVDGVALCRMFQRAIRGHSLPK